VDEEGLVVVGDEEEFFAVSEGAGEGVREEFLEGGGGRGDEVVAVGVDGGVLDVE
jgi:hypothetical protein